MARKARNTQNSTYYLIKQKSNLSLFRDHLDTEAFIQILKETKQKYLFKCYGFSCCEKNSFSLVIETRNISKIMQSIQIAYSKYYKATEPLFKERYKSKPLFTKDEIIIALESLSKIHHDAACFYSGKIKDTIELVDFYPLDEEPIQNESLKTQETKLNEILLARGCSFDAIQKDSNKRNQCILELYQDANCTLKSLAVLFNLSPSSISKIIKNEANLL